MATASSWPVLIAACLLLCGPTLRGFGAPQPEEIPGGAPEGQAADGEKEDAAFELPPPDLDFSDHRLLGALDLALRAFNMEAKRRRQFGLEAVTETRKLPEKGPSVFVVKFHVKETVCHKDDNKLWKDCSFKADSEAARGWCSLLLTLSSDKPPLDVGPPNCTVKAVVQGNVVARREHCLGCAVPVGSRHPRVVAAVGVALRKFNNESASKGSELFMLESVDRASEQVLAGLKYDLEFSVVESNCSHSDLEVDPASCSASHFSTAARGVCFASVYFVSSLKKVESTVCCNLLPQTADMPPYLPFGYGPLNSVAFPPTMDENSTAPGRPIGEQARRPPGFGPLGLTHTRGGLTIDAEAPVEPAAPTLAPEVSEVPVPSTEEPGAPSSTEPGANPEPLPDPKISCRRLPSLEGEWPVNGDESHEHHRPDGKPGSEGHPHHHHHHGKHPHHHHGKHPHHHEPHPHHHREKEGDRHQGKFTGGHGKTPWHHDDGKEAVDGGAGGGPAPNRPSQPVKAPPAKAPKAPVEKPPKATEGFSDDDLV